MKPATISMGALLRFVGCRVDLALMRGCVLSIAVVAGPPPRAVPQGKPSQVTHPLAIVTSHPD